MIAQFVFAMLYGYYVHMLAAMAIVGLIVAFNVYYMHWYYKTFVKCALPEVGSRVKLGNKKSVSITESNRNRYPQPQDPYFYQHMTKHRYSIYIVLASSLLCHFQMTKLLYSRFYGFDVFKALWTQSQRYVSHMKRYQCIYLILVEIPLLAACAFGIMQVPMATQLHITMWETALITLALALMTLLELRSLKSLFGSNRQNKYRASAAMKDWKRIRMKNMILKVRKAEYF